jgi:hypothetical protein
MRGHCLPQTHGFLKVVVSLLQILETSARQARPDVCVHGGLPTPRIQRTGVRRWTPRRSASGRVQFGPTWPLRKSQSRLAAVSHDVFETPIGKISATTSPGSCLPFACPASWLPQSIAFAADVCPHFVFRLMPHRNSSFISGSWSNHVLFNILAAIVVRVGKWGLEEQLHEKTAVSNCAWRFDWLLGRCRERRARDQHA